MSATKTIARTYSPYMSPGEQIWLERKNEVRVTDARSDWRASLDVIEWESTTFRNEIPFSGDTRTLLRQSPDTEQGV